MKNRSLVEKILLAGVIVSAIAITVLFESGVLFRIFRNTTASMEPTLPQGVRLIAVGATTAVRGEIIVFRYPPEPTYTYVKRVIATGGDTVEIRDKVVFLNGVALREPYVRHGDARAFPSNPMFPEPFRSRDQMARFVVQPDSYFVLGDNRDYSSDSRYWGTVPRSNIIGHVVLAVAFKGGVWRPR
jgi:signal peptidase I